MGNTTWRSEPTDVEKSVDELRLGVKCQSSQELAGSPRNVLGSQTASDKIRSQEGNSPERQLRSQIYAKWLRR